MAGEERKELPKPEETKKVEEELEDIEEQAKIYEKTLPETPLTAVRKSLLGKAEEMGAVAKYYKQYRDLMRDLLTSGEVTPGSLMLIDMIEESRLWRQLMFHEMWKRIREESEKKSSSLKEALKEALAPLVTRLENVEKKVEKLEKARRRKTISSRFKKLEKRLEEIARKLEEAPEETPPEHVVLKEKIEELERKIEEAKEKGAKDEIQALKEEISELKTLLSKSPIEYLEEEANRYERLRTILKKLGIKEEKVITEVKEEGGKSKIVVNWSEVIDKVIELIEKLAKMVGGTQPPKEVPPPPPPPPSEEKEKTEKTTVLIEEPKVAEAPKEALGKPEEGGSKGGG